MIQKLFYFGSTHGVRMLFVMKKDESLDPTEVGLLGTDTVVLYADYVSQLIEQFFLDNHECKVYLVV